MPDSIVGLEYLPNAHIDKITYQSFEEYSKAFVTVALYDYADATWSSDEKFTGYLGLSCFLVWNKTIILSLNSGDALVSDLSNSQYVFKLISGFDDLQVSTINIKGKVYKKFKKQFSFIVPNTAYDLSCYATSRIEIQDLIDNESLDLSFSPIKSYIGSIKSEKILESGEQMSTSVVLLDDDGEVWTGPVHRMGNGEYMAGSQHGEIPEKNLTRQIVNNSKIDYLLPITLLPTPETQRPSTPGNPGTPATRRSTYYQEEFIEDNDRNSSNTTIVNLEEIYLQESSVGLKMFEKDKDLFSSITQQTNLQNIEVNRFATKLTNMSRFNLPFSVPDYSQPTLIVRSNNNSQTVKSKSTYKVSPREVVSVNPNLISDSKRQKFFNGKNLTQQMLKSAQKVGSIEQLDLSLPKSLRAINFTDYEIKSQSKGKYKYQIKISMQDECFRYCKTLLKELMRYSKKIENLYNVIVMKNAYTGDQFKVNFLQEFYSQYNVTVDLETGFVTGTFNTEELKSSYVIKSFESLQIAERLIGKQPRANTMVNSLNMFTTDPERIASTLEYYNKIIQLFKETYDLQDGRGTKKSSTSSRKDKGVLDTTINLKKTYERKMIMPIGINFISMNKMEGTPKINFNIFNQRSNTEVKKFFPGVINQNSDELSSLPKAVRESFANIQENKFMDFSPAKFFFGNEEVDTTEINPTSFNADFFNTLRVTAAALKNNESTESQDNTGPIEQSNLEKYTDSREFLGDQTKFNRLIFKTLLRKPLQVQKIRSKFRLMDNKILSSNKKKLSLKKFDLSQPNNLISNVIKNDKEQIPMQIKALSLLKTPMTNFDLNTIDFDPLSNPQTQEVFTQNYLNIGKVEYLEGFERIDGRIVMDKPIYKEIKAKMVDNLKEKNVLCKIVQKSFNGLTVDNEQFNIHDKVFVMNNKEQTNSGDTNG